MTGSDTDPPTDDILEWFSDLRSREAERRVRRAGLFYGESPGVIARLVGAAAPLRAVLVLERRTHLLEQMDIGAAIVRVVSDPDLRAIVGFDMHRGMIGLFERPRPPTPDRLDGTAIVCIVEGVGDDANIGAIVRTAAALGAGALVLDERTADPFTRRAVRVSMGSIGLVPVIRSSEWPPEMPGRTVVAMTPSGDLELGEIELSGPVAVAIGSEGAGLSRSMLDASDLRVRIEMGPGIDSLSVSHAAAVALDHVRRVLSPR